MKIIYNDRPLEVGPSESLLTVLEQERASQLQGVAVAVNFEVIPREQWGQITLNENDQILVVQATQGG